MRTPVLLLIWRRPQTLRLVIDAMRPVAPKSLFVACDGPNPHRPLEREKVSACRALIESAIDWPCEIKRYYADSNQGCRLGVSRAISWFFDQIEEGIILEDDCVPHHDFFHYCTTLLERYRHDTRVWSISGSNFQNGHLRGDGSYYFSHYAHCWGWASWRRCWQHYDADLSKLKLLIESGLLESIFSNPLEKKYWQTILTTLRDSGKPDTWDYQWVFTCLINNGLTAIPNGNLVANVGFNQDATHTNQKASRQVNPHLSGGLRSIKSPTFVLRDITADRYSFEHVFGGKNLRFPRSFLRIPQRAASSVSDWLNYMPNRSRPNHD